MKSRSCEQLTLPFPTVPAPVRIHEAPAVQRSRNKEPHIGRATIKDWPRADRPRDKLLGRGPAAVSNAELLAILLRSGPPGRSALDEARTLLAEHDDNWRILAARGPGELRDAGLGTAKVAQLLAALEIAKRYGENEFKPGEALRGSCDIYAHSRERPAAETCESFYSVLVDNKHRKMGAVVLGSARA